MVRRFLVVLATLVLLIVGCSDDPTSGGAPPLPAGTVARLEVSPPGALVTPDHPTTFVAKAFDANGQEIAANPTWTSNDPSAIAIGADGRATAVKALGSATVTAEVNGIRASVLAVAAEVAPGAVLLDDDRIVGLPAPLDPNAKLAVGVRYRVTLVGALPPVGTIVVSTGSKPVAGRIVEEDATSIVVEQLTLKQVFPHLAIRQTLNLEEAPSTTPGLDARLEKDFKLGSVDCHVEGSVGDFELAKKDFSLAGSNMSYELAWDDASHTIVVHGQPKITFELEPIIKGQVAGTLKCTAILRELQIPLPGPLGIFLGAVIPLGIGFEVGATASLTQAGVNLKGGASGKMDFGFRCDGEGANCTAVTDVESNGELTPRLIPPELSLADAHFDPTFRVFGFAKLEGGGRFSSTLRAEAVEAEVGFKIAGSLATEETQAKLPDYASSYSLSFLATAGPSGALESFLGLVEVAVSVLQFEKEVPIGESPKAASVKGAPESFTTGDDVTFDVKLDPAKVNLPVIGYNVETVRIYRVTDQGTLVLANEAQATPGQTDFSIKWVATASGTLSGHFVAFVKTVLSDLRFDIGDVGTGGTTTGTFVSNQGSVVPITEGYSFVIPPNNSEFGTTDKPLAVGTFFYSDLPEGYLVCSKQEKKANSGLVEVAFGHDDAIVPGTYAFVGVDAVLHSGEFTAIIKGLGPACTETFGEFQSGSLTITAGSDGEHFKGTFHVNTGAGPDATGTFDVASCTKTFAERQALDPICQTGG